MWGFNMGYRTYNKEELIKWYKKNKREIEENVGEYLFTLRLLAITYGYQKKHLEKFAMEYPPFAYSSNPLNFKTAKTLIKSVKKRCGGMVLEKTITKPMVTKIDGVTVVDYENSIITVETEEIPPDPQSLKMLLTHIGYLDENKKEEDVIDNSIDEYNKNKKNIKDIKAVTIDIG